MARRDRSAGREAEDLQHEIEASAAQDADRRAADLDRTRAEADRVTADQDQAASDANQREADRDQHASDRDQAAADWESSHTGRGPSAQQAHDRSRSEREETSRERDSTEADRSWTSAQRLAGRHQRDEVARVRDLVAGIRDRTAQARDDAASARDTAAEEGERRAMDAGTLDEAFVPLRELRALGASVRQRSRLERIAAARDRDAAAADRHGAAPAGGDDGLDALTGVFQRSAGELALTHEIDRSWQAGRCLVLAMIDVDRLQAVNETLGHGAGDALLRAVSTAIMATLRSYDVTVRWGGDEFVCALSDVSLERASGQIAEIQGTLEDLHPGASISTGLAELCHDDTLESLIARADAALKRSKANRDL